MLAAAGSRVLAAPSSRSIGQVAGSQRQATRRPAARRPLPPAAATSSSSGSTDPFSAAFKRAGSSLEEWVKQQRLNERLNSGLGAAGRAAKQAADEAQRTARKVDAEYEVSAKAAEAARTASEAAAEFDTKFRVRQKTRNFYKDFKRRLPLRMRAINDFLNTPMGAVTFLFLFLVSVFTGAFWVILRVLFSFMWLSLLLGPLAINYLNAKAAAAQKARYREYQQEQQRRQADPFYNTPFEGIFGGSGGDSAKRSSRFGGKHPAAMSSVDIIDVEATTLDRD